MSTQTHTPGKVGDLVILVDSHAAYVGTAGHVDTVGLVLTVDVPGRFAMVRPGADTVGDYKVSVTTGGAPGLPDRILAELGKRAGGGTFRNSADMMAFLRTVAKAGGNDA